MAGAAAVPAVAMAAILRSGKFLRLFSGVARNLAASTGGNKAEEGGLGSAGGGGSVFSSSFLGQDSFAIQNVLPYLGVSDSGHAEDRQVHFVTALLDPDDQIPIDVPDPGRYGTVAKSADPDCNIVTVRLNLEFTLHDKQFAYPLSRVQYCPTPDWNNSKDSQSIHYRLNGTRLGLLLYTKTKKHLE